MRECPVCGAMVPIDDHDAIKLKVARAPDGFCPHCHDAFPDVREGDDEE